MFWVMSEYLFIVESHSSLPLPPLFLLRSSPSFPPPLSRTFTKEAVKELERFNAQKVADFRTKLINYVQLQMHIHRKVINYLQHKEQPYY